MTDTTGGIETVLATIRGRMGCTCDHHGSEGVQRACDEWKDREALDLTNAVATHLLSDAVVERAAETAVDARPRAASDRAVIRAALAAAVGGDTDG